MKQTKRTFCILLCAILLISCFASCAAKPERITDEELKALREQYPYDEQTPIMASVSYDDVQNWEEVMAAIDPYAVVVLEFSGEWFSGTAPHSPLPDVDPEDLPEAVGSISALFHPAVIDKVLWGGEGLEKGEEITLRFGAIWRLKELTPTYQEGGKYVCFLFDSLENNYNIPSYYVEKTETWHLVDQDVILAATPYIKCVDDCSGMYLNTFETFINATFETYLPPDAELTPVEPELDIQ